MRGDSGRESRLSHSARLSTLDVVSRDRAIEERRRDAITRARELSHFGDAVLDLEGRYEDRPGAQPPAPRFSAMLSTKEGL
jgi:hypothetical protein